MAAVLLPVLTNLPVMVLEHVQAAVNGCHLGLTSLNPGIPGGIMAPFNMIFFLSLFFKVYRMISL